LLRSLHIPLGRHHERIDAFRRKRPAYVGAARVDFRRCATTVIVTYQLPAHTPRSEWIPNATCPARHSRVPPPPPPRTSRRQYCLLKAKGH
ncbi:unnamed protein product, partial [Laminaria digitata]